MSSRVPLVALGLLGLLACSDSTSPSSELTIARLAGAWDLSRLEMMRVSDSTVAVDVKAAYGITASLIIRSGGTGTLVVRMSGGSPDTIAVTIAIHGDTLIYNADNGGSYEATVRLDGRTMTWLSLETYPWDVNGTPEDVFERDIWQRQ